MALQLEFISIIIPIPVLEKYHYGGFANFKKHLPPHPYGLSQYDEWIAKEGAMNPYDIETLVAHWQERGLKVYTDESESKWNELCVVDFFGGLTLPCDWLVVKNHYAYHVLDPELKKLSES